MAAMMDHGLTAFVNALLLGIRWHLNPSSADWGDNTKVRLTSKNR